MNIDLDLYLEHHSSCELPILQKIYRETQTRYLNPRMACGHIQGLLLTFLTRMISPSCVLEIGTYTGYSAICLAQGLKSDGILYTIEIDDEIAEIAQQYFDQSDYSKNIRMVVGNAIEVIPRLNRMYDLIYIDGEKREYPQYLDTCLPYLKSGGYLIADNVLWDGKVLDDKTNDKATMSVRLFNEKIKNNPSLDKVLLPLRDGLFLCRKK
ncbi:MAG: O-methyltransferase [Bacteroidales bacterium]|nr:O-methyltransferase [Bacteroidales bacterium]